MTDALTRRGADVKPVEGRGRRLGRSLAYGALLPPVGAQTMADAVLGERLAAGQRWQKLASFRRGPDSAGRGGRAGDTTATAGRGIHAGEPGTGVVFGYGLISAVLGLASWFLMLLVLMAVVRGPFWGFVDHGAVEPGTWGGPTRAGAWTAHGLIAVPCVVAFLFALRGIAALQAQLVRPLYGQASRSWVLPATIVMAAGCLAFFWSWLQQL